MNVIDALLVTLGIDASGMRKGADEAQKAQDKIQADAEKSAAALTAAQKKGDAAAAASTKKRTAEESAARKKAAAEEAKQAKEKEQNVKKAGDALSKVRNEVLGLLTAYLGLNAIKNAGERTIEGGIHNSLKSGALGVGAKALSAWKGAAKEFGASGEEIEATFAKINSLQTGLQTGDAGALSTFQAYAQTLAAKSGGKVKANTSVLMDRNADQQAVLLELAKETSQLSEKDAVQALSKLGIAENTALALHSGNIALAMSLDKYGKMHKDAQALSDDSRQLNAKWTEFTETLAGAGESIVVALMPAIKGVLNVMVSLAKWATNNIPITVALIVSLGAALASISAISFAGLIGQVAALTGGLGAVAVGAQKAIGLLGSAGLVLAAGAAGYAIGSAIYSGIEETKLGDKIGRLVTVTLAAFGNKEAKATLEAELNTKAGLQQPVTKPGGAAPGKAASGKVGGSTSSAPAEVVAAAQAAEARHGVPAEVTIAQWRLESANGKRMPAGSNNPFGIKARAGQPYVEAETKEFINGQMQTVKQRFAKFDSIGDAFEAHAKLLATGSAYAEARKHKDDPAAYADALTGRYATDPQYGSKLKALMPTAAIDRSLNTGAQASVAANQTNSTTHSSSTSTVETNINGPITISAPNAKTNGDVASAIGDKLHSYMFASQANVGLA